MTFKTANRVLESTTTTGTGDLTLAGAFSADYRTFADAYTVGQTLPYYIIGNGEREEGIGTYSATNTLTRTRVLSSSNSDALVSFSAGTKAVGVGPLGTTGAGIDVTSALSGTTPAFSAANGTRQTWTLSGTSTPTDDLADGQEIRLMILGGGNTITWPTISWTSGSEPSLDLNNYLVVDLWKVGTTLYGDSRGYIGGPTPVNGTPSLTYQNSALDAYFTALSSRDTTPVGIIVAGHSGIEGYVTTAVGERWVTKLADSLRTSMPTSGATGVAGASYVPAAYATSGTPAYNPYTSTAGTPTFTTNGLGGRGLEFNGSGDQASYAFTGTSFDLFMSFWYADGEQFTITIDGGSPITINRTSYGTGEFRYNSGALGSGAHTVVIDWVAGTPRIEGFTFFNGDETAGIRVYEAGHAGAVSSSSYLFDTTTSHNMSLKLAVFELCRNDYNANTAATTWKTNMQSRISAARTFSGDANLPCLIVMTQAPYDLGSRTYPYSDFVTQAKAIADADAYTAVLDLSGEVPSAQADSGHSFWHTDLLHQHTVGHATLAGYVAAALRFN